MNTTAIPKAAPFFRFADLIATTCSRMRRETRVRRAVRDLSDMPDYLLRDIGVARSEILSVVRHGPANRYSADVGDLEDRA